MRKNYFLFVFSILLGLATQAQSGIGHDPDLVLSYTPTGYTAATTMRQDNGYTSFSKNTVNNNGGGTDLFFNFTFDTTGKNMFVAYTTDGSDPSTSSTAVNGAFSNYSDPNRTWVATIPAQSSNTTVKYVFYASDSDIASSWGRISATGYTTNLGDAYTPFSYTVYESNVAAGGNWNTGTTWNGGSSPNSTTIPVEIIGTNTVTLNQNANTGNLNVLSEATLNINSGNSLIVNGTSTGNVTYNRTLGTTNWYLMSPPVSSVTFNDAFVTANNIDDTNGTGNNRGVAEYTTASNTWSYLQSGGTINTSAGKGYSVKQDVAGNVAFTGTINTADVTPGIATTGSGFNLLGNPYTSHINSKTFLDANSNLDQTQLWVWNQASGSYDVKTNASAFILAPTQGFFVKANSGTQVTFAESNQSTSGGTFQKTAKTEVKLLITDGTKNRYASILYTNNTTKGFDFGWEGEVFGGVETGLEFYTNLVEQNQGKKYQVQSLPNSDLESLIVPVGVNSKNGGEITFTAQALNLPTNYKVYLEDRANNTFTRLDQNNDEYKVTVSNGDTNGRFFLHTKTSSVLSLDSEILNSVSIYKTSNYNLRVAGLQKGKTTIALFNIVGKKVMNTTFEAANVNEITIPKLASGVYLVQLQTINGKLNKKIVLE